MAALQYQKDVVLVRENDCSIIESIATHDNVLMRRMCSRAAVPD